MTPVGTDQGTGFIYDRTDLFLGTPAAPDFLAKIALASTLKKGKEKSDAKQKLDNLQPDEYWIRHDKELRDEVSSIQTMGAEIMSAGVDPFTGTDKASLEFQKRMVRAEKAAQFSMQLKDYHKFLAEKLATESKDGGDRYTTESKDEAAKYLERGLFENMDSGQVPPVLEVKRPLIDILAYDSKFAKDALTSGKEYSDGDIASFALDSLGNQQVAEAISSQLSSLKSSDPAAFDLLKNKAQNEGMSLQQYMRYEQMKPHFSKGPFDFLEIEKQMTPAPDASTKETGDVTKMYEGVSEKKIRSLATAIVDANPKYIQEGVKQGRFGSPTNSIDANKQAAIDWNVKRIKSTVGSKSSTLEDETYASAHGGYSKEQVKDNADLWLKALRSDDMTNLSEALGYLKNAKVATADGRQIVDFQVYTKEQIKQMPAAMRLKFEGAEKGDGKYLVQLKTTRGVMGKDPDGNPVYQQSEDSFVFDPKEFDPKATFMTSSFDEEMLNLHDASFKSTQRPFGTTLPEFKVPTTGGGDFIIVE